MRRRLPLACALVTACTLPNPAFNEPETAGEETATSDPGDGDSGDGDSGDGDSGDGDGDGDGDADSGDGDGDPEACLLEEANGPYLPVALQAIEGIDMTGAPEFNAIPMDCYSMTICAAEQANCGPNTNFLGRYRSGGSFAKGSASGSATPIKLQFHPGPAICGEPLQFGTQQSFELIYSVRMVEHTIAIRLPCVDGEDPTLFVADDGSTFWDPLLMQPAAVW